MSFSQIIPGHIQRIPAYRSENPAEEIERTIGVPVVQLGMNENPFGPSPKAVEAARKYMDKIAPYPNNPTGTMVRRGELERFMKRVPEHTLTVLDEAYFEYVDDPDYPDSLEYVRAGRPVLILRTFSKVFGLAGLRIGYGIATREIIDTLYKVRMAFNTNSVAQVAALAAWDDHEHVQKSVSLNRAELEFLYRELSKRGVKHVPSFANFVLLELGRPAREVTAALLKQGVIVRPAWG